MPDVLTILSIMPKKVKRKSSFGRPSASDGAKRKAKYSQEKDDFNENAAKGMRIIRYMIETYCKIVSIHVKVKFRTKHGIF